MHRKSRFGPAKAKSHPNQPAESRAINVRELLQPVPRTRDYHTKHGAVNVPLDAWYTTTEAAAYLKVNLKTIQRACASGEMRHTRVGDGMRAEYRIRREWLDDWMMRYVRGGESR